jgi:ABC-type phosphate transport system substrate-binding protein
MNKTKLLMGASALVASLALAGAASAAATNVVYGTGSSLAAPYLDEIEGCFGPASPLDVQTSTVGTTPGSLSGNGTTQSYPVCTVPTQAVIGLRYMSSSSGYGEAAIFSNSAATYAGLTSAGTAYPGLEYAAGDYGLKASDVTAYDCTGAATCSVSSGSTLVTVEPHGQSASASPPTVFANPFDTYGALIQAPLLITPVAIVYNPVYKAVYNPAKKTVPTTYSFNVHSTNADGSGGLQLDVPTLCAIFNGKIQNWNDPAITRLNGGVSLKATADTGTFSVPIELVGRSDTSGTTSIFYRALAAQCNGAYSGGTYTNNYAAAGGKQLPAALGGGATPPATQIWSPGAATLTPIPGQFSLAKGSGNVAQYVALSPVVSSTKTIAVQGKIAYIGPDYALPAGKSTLTPGGKILNVVDIVTGGLAIEPTAANALAAFTAAGGATGLLPPQTTSAGAYSASATAVGLRAAPQDWAEPITTTVLYSNATTPVATPLAAPPTGYYPLVGTSNIFLNTCYKNAASVTALTSFLKYYYTQAQTKTVLNRAGLAQLPTVWSKAILTAFAPTQGYTTDGLKLNIAAGGTATQCTGHTGAL